MGFKPFTPQGEAGSWEHPPDCMFCARAGVYDDSVSQLSLPILMQAFYYSPSVQELLSQFLYFFQRQLLHLQLYILCVHWRRGVSQPPMLPSWSNFFFYFIKDFIYLFLDRKEGRKTGRETSMCGCLSCTPYWGPGLQSRHVL